MKDLIKNIIAGKGVDNIFNFVLQNLYKQGPVSVTDMEILSLLKIYRPEEFKKHKESILNYMAVFYKETEASSLKDVVFRQYKKHILDTYNESYTPIQASIVKGIADGKCFSFSAPTSTGKSFVFMNEISKCINDVVVIVPSRALINEYYLKLCDIIQDKSINILTFVDKINTKRTKRNVFVVTPERCRELFRQKSEFTVDLFLFDEAQLGNEDSKRGLFFDSIVRRCQNAFPDAKFVFAHPFVANPESQIKKNHFLEETSKAKQYTQMSVGQTFLCKDENWNFYHFGIDKAIMGATRQKCSFDPIKDIIESGGSVLFYVSKSKIYNKGFLNEFGHYIDLCQEISNEKVDYFIDQLKLYTGGDTIANKNHYSQMIALLKRGIVIHHGSLPLQTRIIIEQFTQEGFCKMCFATSTLEQGINMPFDLVYLDRFEASKSLSVKNLIGRAGRATTKPDFDFGYVLLRSPNNMSDFRRIMTQEEVLDDISALEKDDSEDDDYNDFKEAILNDTFSDEYNLTENELKKLTDEDVEEIIKRILDTVFVNERLISFSQLREDKGNSLPLYGNFEKLYSIYLGRELADGERNVLYTAIKIILWRVYGKTFKEICWYRYSYVSRTRERSLLERQGRRTDSINASFLTGYSDIPNKNLPVYSLFSLGTKAKDVDYDLIMYDTYDYLDKLIGFKLSDVFYATFIKYYIKIEDLRAKKLAKYIKYGTDCERHIWMLRYGLSFEDIEILDDHIDSISSEEIIFKETINEVPEEDRISIERFI